ncbi:caspase-8-like isoform X2 [Anneissia japonica]|uniref:caspase-8-like isoform X2 n=1 Tax=Anneissia japonica TaxID=1529436 RepID=UPI001425AA1F|nr:caspase-8-like isoform X2 [Anneissia japonica]
MAEDRQYDMSSEIKGMVLIINNHSEDRCGSTRDVACMKEMWIEFGFLPFTHTDLSTEEMIKKMKVFSRRARWQSVGCLVVMLMSHGGKDGLLGQHKKTLDYPTIFKIFNEENCPLMKGKPKLIFIQACRGRDGIQVCMDTSQQSYIEEENPVFPRNEDTYIAYSTTYGCVSIREKKSGSVFIQAIDKVFRQAADKNDYEILMTKVKNEVSNFKGSHNLETIMQQPVVCGFLKKTLYLKEQI